MSNLERRTPRKELEKRAYRFGVGTAVFGLGTFVSFAVALFSASVGMGTVLILAALTIACAYGFKKTVS